MNRLWRVTFLRDIGMDSKVYQRHSAAIARAKHLEELGYKVEIETIKHRGWTHLEGPHLRRNAKERRRRHKR